MLVLNKIIVVQYLCSFAKYEKYWFGQKSIKYFTLGLLVFKPCIGVSHIDNVLEVDNLFLDWRFFNNNSIFQVKPSVIFTGLIFLFDFLARVPEWFIAAFPCPSSLDSFNCSISWLIWVSILESINKFCTQVYYHK